MGNYFKNLTNKDIRRHARESLRGNWGKGALVVLIIMAMIIPISVIYSGVLTLITISSAFNTGGLGASYYLTHLIFFLSSIVLHTIIEYGTCSYFLKVSRGEEAKIKDVFSGFKCIFKLLGLYLLEGLLLSSLLVVPGIILSSGLTLATSVILEKLLLLGFCLLVVPGIILSLGLMLDTFVIIDNPDISIIDALKESFLLMKGYKMRLFLLILSFIGWSYLSGMIFGLGLFLLMPYYYTSVATFYDHVCANCYEYVEEE